MRVGVGCIAVQNSSIHPRERPCKVSASAPFLREAAEGRRRKKQYAGPKQQPEAPSAGLSASRLATQRCTQALHVLKSPRTKFHGHTPAGKSYRRKKKYAGPKHRPKGPSARTFGKPTRDTKVHRGPTGPKEPMYRLSCPHADGKGPQTKEKIRRP
jgi:hypothetical protein